MSALELEDARDLLPLYAGGDLDAEEQQGVAEALARFPELRAELEGWTALEDRLAHAFVPDAAQLLPLYAGNDLTPGQRAEVDAALEARPELRAELGRFTELEGLLERSLQPQPLSPREASELLPLHAGGDLDPVAARQVERAVAEHAELAADLEAYRTVDTRLQAAYPAGEVTPLPAAATAPLVRLQCPFCHDALQNAPVALCGSCSTPHHTTCFEQNQGCSILGCEGTEAVARRQATLRVCGECGRHTQADAPFCAWCGTANTSRRAPLHARRDSAALVLKPAVAQTADDPEPTPEVAPVRPGPGWGAWLRAAAAIALTLSSLGAGLAFGQREQRHVQSWVTSTAVVKLAAAEQRALATLEAAREAQARFKAKDWDGDGLADYAESLAELRAVARGRQEETEALVDTSWEAWFTTEWASRPPTDGAPAGYRLTLRVRYPGLGVAAGWTAEAVGPIEQLPPAEGRAP